MNKKVLEILEFAKIKQQIAGYAITDPAKSKINRLIPQKEQQIVQSAINQTTDAVNILRLFGGFPIAKVANVIPIINRIKKQSIPSGRELAQILLVLRISNNLIEFTANLKERKIDLIFFNDFLDHVQVNQGLLARLNRSVDEEGNILDRASSELFKIRQRINSLKNEQKKCLEQIIHGPEAKYLSEPLITIRDNRQVLPVKAENKVHFGGIVHDQSATGQTLFIEPQVILNLNNELQISFHQEKAEIQRILSEISQDVFEESNSLIFNARLIYDLDFAQAKALYAKQINATLPIISQNQEIKLKAAFHPLIDFKKVVKNDFLLGGKNFQMVITGPNTGGKTITLKTVGLIQIMGQSGLYIPANEGSEITIFSDILADIGDEQSIEQNLSTFSSHMRNIVNILKDCSKDSLILFDEIGAGTDPEEGASLAISILKYLKKIGSFVIATTHYPELKLYAYNTKEVENASMEFNLDTLSPTYHLLIGVPGRSNAFAISERLGLNLNIIKNAEELMDNDTVGINEMLDNLENDRKQLQLNKAEIIKQKERLTQIQTQLDLAKEQLMHQQDKIISQAHQKASQIVTHAEKETQRIINNLQRQGKSNTLSPNTIINAKTKMKALKNPLLKNNPILKKVKADKELKKGDTVYLPNYEKNGVLLKKMSNNSWLVQIGILKMTVSTDQLEKAKTSNDTFFKPKIKNKIKSGLKRNSEIPSGRLDLRGKRYDEAQSELDHFIDASLLSNYPSVIIIHGFGTGTIRNLVHETLKNNPRVANFHYAPANEGGHGATIVNFQ